MHVCMYVYSWGFFNYEVGKKKLKNQKNSHQKGHWTNTESKHLYVMRLSVPSETTPSVMYQGIFKARL